MKNFFADPERYELGDLIDHILTTQVQISWEQEVTELERHGLNDAKSILDIGTGTGLFLCHMASRSPKTRFVGVETSERLIGRAKNTAREMKLTNVSFIFGQCPMELKQKFEYILARLTVYCSPEPSQLLSWAQKILESSGRIAIIELDYDWIYTYPHDPIIEKMFMEHRREFERHGADCSIGKKAATKS